MGERRDMGKSKASKTITLLIILALILPIGIPLVTTTVQTQNQLEYMKNQAILSTLTLSNTQPDISVKYSDIVDTDGDSRFTPQPPRQLPYYWVWVHDHDTFQTRAYNGNFLYTLCGEEGHGDPLYYGTWTVSLPQSGVYEVFVWIPNPDPFEYDGRVYTPTQSAIYQIYHKDGVATRTVNQRLRTGGFYSLGTFNFDTTAYVILNDRTGEPYCSTMIAFDAIKFVRINQLPTAIIDSITPNPAEQGKDIVSFAGHGTDSDGSIVAYNWRSSINGQLSTLASFTEPASQLSIGTHTIYFRVQDNDGSWSTETPAYLTINPAQTQQPILFYSPTSHNFGDKYEGATDSTTFDVWNSGGQTLTYSLSGNPSWVTVHPTSGSSTGEHDTIIVDIDTTGLSQGSHSCYISISSNGGSATFTVTVNVIKPPDTTPETVITSGPSGTIDYNDVTFTWTGSDDVTPTSALVYSYYLEGYDAGWSGWTLDTSKSYYDLPNGDYTFRVKAEDQAGNVDPTPAVNYFTISVGWTFAIITDLHIGFGPISSGSHLFYLDYGGETYNDDGTGQDYWLTDRLEGIVKWINDNKDAKSIHFVVVLGDMADTAEYSELVKVRDILNGLEVPYIPLIGNHDNYPYTQSDIIFPDIRAIFGIHFWKTFWNSPDYQDRYFNDVFWEQNEINVKRIEGLFGNSWKRQNLDFHPLKDTGQMALLQNYVFTYKGIRFIALDFVDRNPDNPRPRLFNETATWLTENLDKYQPNILLSHHPIIRSPADFSDTDADKIWNIISNSDSSILANFAGHVHDNDEEWEFAFEVVTTEAVCRESTYWPTGYPGATGKNIRLVAIPASGLTCSYNDWGNIGDETVNIWYRPHFKLGSPADLVITDPEEGVVTKELGVFNGMFYAEFDVDWDGELEDLVVLQDLKMGDYLIRVVPEPGALPQDTYVLEFINDSTVFVLAKNIQISDIPDQPYLIESTETTINAAPMAEAGGPYEGYIGSPITFDASGSYDPDGSIILYEWDFDGDGVYDASSILPTATFTWENGYVGNVTLRVTDDDGLTRIDAVEVKVGVAPAGAIDYILLILFYYVYSSSQKQTFVNTLMLAGGGIAAVLAFAWYIQWRRRV